MKVGPALTFAMREALEALEQIEGELVAAEKRSHLMDVLERAMLDDPRHWQHHYHGSESEQRLLRRYSYSDRVRYYWTAPAVKDAVERLMENLSRVEIPETMLSAYLPDAYRAVRAGELKPEAKTIVIHRIRGVIAPYAEACANENNKL